MIKLTQDIVQDLLDYDIITGEIRWRYRDVIWFKNGSKYSAVHTCSRWNRKNAGKLAGSIDGRGYAQITIFGRVYKAHKIIWLLVYGENPISHIDHKNGIKTDNRLENLHLVMQAENNKNQAMRKNNTSGFKGVSKHGSGWRARIWLTTDNKRVHKCLGTYSTPEEAHTVYALAAVEAGYTYRHIFGDGE